MPRRKSNRDGLLGLTRYEFAVHSAGQGRRERPIALRADKSVTLAEIPAELPRQLARLVHVLARLDDVLARLDCVLAWLDGFLV